MQRAYWAGILTVIKFMTPIHQKPEVQALWEKLEGFQLNDNLAAFGYAARLARENGWTPGFTARVISEYKRFLLMAVHAGHPVTPSEAVDQAWHLHLVYTRSYWEKLCRDVLGRPFHHEPTAGGVDEAAKFQRQYQQTLDSYEKLFSHPAPADIWPPVEIRFQPMRSRWVDVSKHWMLPKPAWLKMPGPAVSRAVALLMLAVVFLAGCQPVMQVLDLRGGEFLQFYLFSFGLALIASFVGLRILRGSSGRIRQPLMDRYDIAFLGGGADRVADAVLAALYGMNLVKVDTKKGSGLIRADDASMPRQNLHPVESLVLNAIPASQATPPHSLRKSLLTLFHEMQERLTREGLWENRARLKRLRWIAALPLLMVMLIGVAKVFVGIERDRPVGLLVIFLIFSSILLLWRVSHVSRRTSVGDQMWDDLKKNPPVNLNKTNREHLAGDPAQVALMVALGGFTMLQLPGYEALYSSLYRPVGTDSGSSGGCSTSSDSGSGCGSSGCGGCGGGGD